MHELCGVKNVTFTHSRLHTGATTIAPLRKTSPSTTTPPHLPKTTARAAKIVSKEAEEAEETNEVEIDDRELLLLTCEDLLRSGKRRSGVYLVRDSPINKINNEREQVCSSQQVDEMGGEAAANEKGRSFRRRKCEQTSSGGGWTVAVPSSFPGFLIVVAMSLTSSNAVS